MHENIESNQKISFLIFIAIVAVVLYLIQYFSFPVKYKICDVNYNDCEVIAKYKDRYDCEITNKKWGWACDESDKSNITCTEEASTFSSGFCD